MKRKRWERKEKRPRQRSFLPWFPPFFLFSSLPQFSPQLLFLSLHNYFLFHHSQFHHINNLTVNHISGVLLHQLNFLVCPRSCKTPCTIRKIRGIFDFPASFPSLLCCFASYFLFLVFGCEGVWSFWSFSSLLSSRLLHGKSLMVFLFS